MCDAETKRKWAPTVWAGSTDAYLKVDIVVFFNTLHYGIDGCQVHGGCQQVKPQLSAEISISLKNTDTFSSCKVKFIRDFKSETLFLTAERRRQPSICKLFYAVFYNLDSVF